MSVVTLRSVTDDDAFRLYRWRKDIDVVRWNGGRPRELSWQEHVDWLCDHVNIAHHYIGLVDGVPVGAVRLEPLSAIRTWDVSIVIDPQARGKGYGPAMLLALPPVGTVVARIHRLNLPSVRAFERAGYVSGGTDGAWLIYNK